jgi:signal transduction histidine kinase
MAVGGTAAESAVAGRVAAYANPSDLQDVVEALREQRDGIVAAWQRRVADQPFHLGRQGRAVADHIPALIDAVIRSLEEDADPGEQVTSPIVREDVQEAVSRHAMMRSAQGLSPLEVVTELRILRQEIFRALRHSVAPEASIGDLLAGVLAMCDALDGALGVAVSTVADAVDQQRAELIGVTAHDLKTPLATIHGYLQLSQRTAAREPAGKLPREYFERMLGAVDQMRELIDDVMVLSQVSVAAQIRPVETDLTALLQDLVASLGPEARERIRVVKPARARLTGRWDAGYLRRAFENLLSNALKYSPEGDVLVTLRSLRRHIEVQIVDRGIGLSTEDREQLFSRFYRSPEAVRRQIEGTGLGLFISRAMIQANGGTLTLESAGPGKGTTAVVVLPRSVRIKADDGPRSGRAG